MPKKRLQAFNNGLRDGRAMVNKSAQQFVKIFFSDMWKLRHAVFGWRHGNVFWYDKEIFDFYLSNDQELEIFDCDERSMRPAIGSGQSRKRIKRRYKARARRNRRATARKQKMAPMFLLWKRVMIERLNENLADARCRATKAKSLLIRAMHALKEARRDLSRQNVSTISANRRATARKQKMAPMFLSWKRVMIERLNENLADARCRATKAKSLAIRAMHALKEARHDLSRQHVSTISARPWGLKGGADENIPSSRRSDMEEENGSERSAHEADDAADPDFEFKKNDHDSEGSDQEKESPQKIQMSSTSPFPKKHQEFKDLIPEIQQMLDYALKRETAQDKQIGLRNLPVDQLHSILETAVDGWSTDSHFFGESGSSRVVDSAHAKNSH